MVKFFGLWGVSQCGFFKPKIVSCDLCHETAIAHRVFLNEGYREYEPGLYCLDCAIKVAMVKKDLNEKATAQKHAQVIDDYLKSLGLRS